MLSRDLVVRSPATALPEQQCDHRVATCWISTEAIEALYGAFNHRDSDRVLAMMSDDVDWLNAWKGGRLPGREAVRDHWTAQWSEIDPHVEPLSVTGRADGRLGRWRRGPRAMGSKRRVARTCERWC